MHTSVREINLCSDTSYFLRVDWEGCNFSTGFQLLLTDGQDAWRGEVRGEVVCNEAEELEMPLERYIEDVEQAFTGRENSNTYNFTLTPNPPGHSSTLTLTYEKMQKDISFRLGCVLLKAVPEPAEAVRNLLIHSLQRGNNLQHHNQRLQEENERLRGEQQHITAELKRYVGGKEALEAELYSRFVLVLNEKKAKIRSLQQDVTKLEEMRCTHLLAEDLISVCECDVCRKCRRERAAPLMNIQTGSPLELLFIAYLSIESEQSNTKDVLVMIDDFTKFAMAVPTPNQ
uniref:X-ray repair complementing defective repair in Chinese hamster cells 4 n=1 Tax=Pundamilia nyererei TaxID=303518 RepID=A0A3B4FYU9_9CICH